MGLALYHVMEDITNIYTTVKTTHELLRIHSSINKGSLVSCSESSRHFPRYEDFPDEKALNAQVIHLDTALFRYPFRIAVKDGIAIIMDLHNADCFFHAFSYPEWKYMTSFGKRGEGPEEMSSADCFRFISTDSIWTLDANRMRTTRWKIEQNMHKITSVETVDMDKRLVRALDFFIRWNQDF